jgi:hypothetical protein
MPKKKIPTTVRETMDKRRTVSSLVRKYDRKKPPPKVNLNQRKFLAAYRGCLSIGKAGKIAGVGPYTHYYWIIHDPDYEKSFYSIHEEVAQQLESEAFRRAFDGQRKLVTHNGKPVFVFVNADGEVVDEEMENIKGVRKVPLYEESRSDAIFLQLLKAKFPEVYRDKTESTVNANIEHSSKVVAYLPEKENDNDVAGNITTATGNDHPAAPGTAREVPGE